MELIPSLAHVAMDPAGGASRGVQGFLQEHRRDLEELFTALAAPAAPAVLVTIDAPSSVDGLARGLRIETLPLRAQRALWTALLADETWWTRPGLAALVRAFVARDRHGRRRWGLAEEAASVDDSSDRAPDAVCVHLARLLHAALGARRSDEASMTWANEVADVDDEAAQRVEHERAIALERRLAELVYVPICVPQMTTSTPTSPLKPARGNRKRRRDVAERPAAAPVGSNARDASSTPSPPSITVVGNVSQSVACERVAALPPGMEDEVTTTAAQLAILGDPTANIDAARMQTTVRRTLGHLQEVMDAVGPMPADHAAVFAVLCERLGLQRTSDDVLHQVTRYEGAYAGVKWVCFEYSPYRRAFDDHDNNAASPRLMLTASGLMDANWSSRYAATFLRASVLPKIQEATSVISRALLQTIVLFAKPSYQDAVIHELMRPLLLAPAPPSSSSSSSSSSFQSEAMTRMLREKCVPVDKLDSLFLAVFGDAQAASTALSSEPKILVIQNALNMKPTLSSTAIEGLVHAAAMAAQAEPSLQKSAKFATLMFTLASKYGNQCAPLVDDLEGITSTLSSVMAKAATRAVHKLKSASASAGTR